MIQKKDLLRRQPGEFAFTQRAEARMVQGHIDKQEVIRQHLTGRWDSYRGVTQVEDGYCFSLCWMGSDTCVMVGERAGILTICCPDDFAEFTPPPGGPS